ncbi:MAG: hypothetical protein ACXVW2_04115 [Nocardioidaceae bacterium]
MAGGMNKRGSFGSMAERVARSKRQEVTTPVPQLKHCWVTDRHGRHTAEALVGAVAGSPGALRLVLAC